MKKILAIVLVLVLAVAALVPYLTGSAVENQFRAGIDQLNKRGEFDFVIESYDRGWLGSNARVSVGYEQDSVTLDNDISHPWVPGLGQTHIVSTLPRDQDATLENLFSEPPLRIDTWITNGDDFQIEARSPVAEGTVEDANGVQTDIEWGGLHARYERSDDDEHIEATVPRLRMADSKGDGAMRDIRFVSDSRLNDRYEQPMLRSVLGSGQAEFSIGQVTFKQPDGRAASLAAKANFTATYGNERGAWHSRFEISDVALDRPGVLEGDKIDIEGGAVELNFDNLRVDALARMLSTLDRIEDTPLDQLPQAQRTAFLADVAAIFDSESQIKLDVPAVQTNRGEAGMGITVGLGEPLSERAREYMPLLARVMQRLQVSAGAFADRSLLTYGIAQSSNPDQVAQSVDEWQRANLVTVNDGRYSIALEYQDNNLALNGQTIPPYVLMALFGGLGQD